MNKEISIEFNRDDFITSVKTAIYIGAIILVFVSLFFKSWLLTLSGFIAVVIIKVIIQIPDNVLKVACRDGNIYLSGVLDSNVIFNNQEIASMDFSWHYRFVKSVFRDYDNNTIGLSNQIQLKLEIILKDGYRIVLYEELYPWEDLPLNWQYKLFYKDDYHQRLFFSGSLKTLKSQMYTLGLVR